jgi:hypothetical protein
MTTKSVDPTRKGASPMAEMSLYDMVNDARQHPMNYPPLQGIGIPPTGEPPVDPSTLNTPCDPFPDMPDPTLHALAQRHNNYWGMQSLAWTTATDSAGNSLHHMHMTDGTIDYSPQGIIINAGFTRAAECVAWGPLPATNPELVLKLWMQEDAQSNWAHRAIILGCDLKLAAVAHLSGTPSGDLWTLCLGTR